MIAVIDYGIGNLRSAEKALQHVGAEACLVSNPDMMREADALVLPGVGAFGACASAIREQNLERVLLESIAEGKPFLGLCVGFQLLFSSSEESPGVPGLGVLSGTVRRLPPEMKLPQMQWNTVEFGSERPPAMMKKVPKGSWFYFVHSYAPLVSDVDAEAVALTAHYGAPFVAAIEAGDIWGTQFHPEKSGTAGLALLSTFVEHCQSV